MLLSIFLDGLGQGPRCAALLYVLPSSTYSFPSHLLVLIRIFPLALTISLATSLLSYNFLESSPL